MLAAEDMMSNPKKEKKEGRKEERKEERRKVMQSGQTPEEEKGTNQKRYKPKNFQGCMRQTVP